MKRLVLAAMAGLVLNGCATSSGVVPTGPDSYVISRRGSSAYAGLGTLKVDAIREANEYCQKDGKQIEVVSSQEGKMAFDYPRAEVNFMCLKPEDSGLVRPYLGPAPASTIIIKR